MGFLVDFSDMVEPRTVEPGEYKLRITAVREDTDKNGNPYIMPNFEIIDEVGAKSFTHFLGLPSPSFDAKKNNSKKYAINQFLKCFDLPTDEEMSEDKMIGAEGWALLGIEEDAEYGDKNRIKKFLIPR